MSQSMTTLESELEKEQDIRDLVADIRTKATELKVLLNQTKDLGIAVHVRFHRERESSVILWSGRDAKPYTETTVTANRVMEY